MDGLAYKRLVEAGYASLKSSAEEVNDLNVFPIPDGDTGDNMCSTLLGGIKEAPEDEDISFVSAKIADGMILGARGNSGVIRRTERSKNRSKARYLLCLNPRRQPLIDL